MQIQSICPTIAMAFDECPSSVADRDYAALSVRRDGTRCKTGDDRPNAREGGVTRTRCSASIRCDLKDIQHAKQIREMDLDVMWSRLHVGETHEQMYYILDEVVPTAKRGRA